MKTYEWIIKTVSYIVCCAVVCAGFALKEKKAENTLNNYLNSLEEQKTSELRGLMIRLKDGLARCVSDNAEKEDFAETAYCCKAVSDLVSSVNKGNGSEALRLFFDRVRNVCDTIYFDKENITAFQRQPLSELYTRLSAIEDMLQSEKTSASELISLMSSGLVTPQKTEPPLNRISVNKAEKYARALMGANVRLRSYGIYDGRFIFASPGSCILLTNKGDPYMKSRTVTQGKEHIDRSVAAEIAENYISDMTGKPCDAKLEDKVFGIYYFTVVCDKKEYPVGVDKTDGNIVFYVISQ